MNDTLIYDLEDDRGGVTAEQKGSLLALKRSLSGATHFIFTEFESSSTFVRRLKMRWDHWSSHRAG